VIDRVCRNKFKRIAWTKADLLIVDEISMMSKKLFDILDGIGRKARRNRGKPFGGMQVMFSGDFYQLPPVGDRDEPDTSAFCFESRAWDTVFPEVVELKKIYRQSDATYVKMLNQIRRGKLSKKSYALLQERVREPPAEEALVATQLVPRRREADAINQEAMKHLDGESQVYTMRRAKDMPMSKADTNELVDTSPTAQEAEVSRLRENVMVDDQLELKIGAQVMCVANIDMEGPRPIVNGSQGIVREFRDGLPLVEFRDGQAHVMGRHVWPSETIPGVGVEQVPLIHAWAITIHKAQGVTLDMAEIDAGSGVFECGQTYVALSRVKSLEGLYLTELDPARIRVNRKVQEFYAGLATPSCTAGIGSRGAGASSIVELLKRQAKAPVAAI
jgi:ATP-dependent DNA helicase PIF1